jgi:DNA-binding NtrC family response regulator
MQVRLLRVLETGRYHRVGGEQELRTRVRIMAATNRVPSQAVEQGTLRLDLMYRLAVFPLAMPPLRECEGDAELLAEHFLRELNEAGGTQKAFTRASIGVIRAHPWPGNVRELKNAIHRAYIMADGLVEVELGQLGAPEAPARTLSVAIGTPLADIEKQVIHSTLDMCQGNKRRCAELLGVSLKTLYNRLAAYHMAPAVQANV